MNLNQYLGLRAGARSRCPFCDARRGLAIWDRSKYAMLDDDASGFFKCFACDRVGSGVTFLVETRTMTRAEASAALGLTPYMVSVDLDAERSRAAWQALHRRKSETVMGACRDLVWLRESMTRVERADWRRHEMLPHRLRPSLQARRQEERVAAYRKEADEITGEEVIL